jgi:hypothetical protein
VVTPASAAPNSLIDTALSGVYRGVHDEARDRYDRSVAPLRAVLLGWHALRMGTPVISLISTSPFRTVAEIREALGTPQWSRAQIDELIERAAAGQSQRHIARLFGRSRGAIAAKLASLRRKGAL